jgi:hypothetical protein
MLRETPLHERSAASLLERRAAPAEVLRSIRARDATFERFFDRSLERVAARHFTIARVIRRRIHVRDTIPPAIVNSRDDSREIVPKWDEFVPRRDDQCELVPGVDDGCGGYSAHTRPEVVSTSR